MGTPEELPDGLVLSRTTPVFDNDTVPSGLLCAHRVVDGVWGRLVVHSGSLVFVFEDTPEQRVTVSPGESVVIPPAREHHVELGGPATFAVEFHRPPGNEAGAPDGAESTGLTPPG